MSNAIGFIRTDAQKSIIWRGRSFTFDLIDGPVKHPAQLLQKWADGENWEKLREYYIYPVFRGTSLAPGNYQYATDEEVWTEDGMSREVNTVLSPKSVEQCQQFLRGKAQIIRDGWFYKPIKVTIGETIYGWPNTEKSNGDLNKILALINSGITFDPVVTWSMEDNIEVDVDQAFCLTVGATAAAYNWAVHTWYRTKRELWMAATTPEQFQQIENELTVGLPVDLIYYPEG